MTRRNLLVVMIILLVTPTAFGEETKRFSLQEALQLAYERNPRVAGARQEVEAAKGRWER